MASIAEEISLALGCPLSIAYVRMEDKLEMDKQITIKVAGCAGRRGFGLHNFTLSFNDLESQWELKTPEIRGPLYCSPQPTESLITFHIWKAIIQMRTSQIMEKLEKEIGEKYRVRRANSQI